MTATLIATAKRILDDLSVPSSRTSPDGSCTAGTLGGRMQAGQSSFEERRLRRSQFAIATNCSVVYVKVAIAKWRRPFVTMTAATAVLTAISVTLANAARLIERAVRNLSIGKGSN